MKLNKFSKRKLIIRSFVAFTLLILFFGSILWTFKSIQTGEKIDRAPKVLRHSFLLNEKLWKLLRSNSRLSVKKQSPPMGKKPRVNGLLGLKTAVNLENYSINIENDKEYKKITLLDIKLLPKVSYATDFRCIEGWSEEMQYAGVRFSEFLKHYKLGIKSDGSYYNYVGLETPDAKYYVSIDMESMLHDQTLLAYEMNQAPLSLKNGAPIRLMIPIKYGIKSLKRVGKIFFSDSRPKDYWAERGYDWYSGL